MQARYRATLLALVAILALSAVVASAASAALPEFKPVPTKKKFTSTSGTVTFVTSTVAISCSKSTTAGEIASASTVGNVVMTFTGCKVASGGKACSVKTLGAKEGEIITKPLKGELGTVKTTEAASGVGLLLEEGAAEKIATFASNDCMGEWTMYGSIAGEVIPIGKKQLTSKVVFAVTAGAQHIKEITVKAGTIKPELEGWHGIWTVEGSNELTFEEAVEVT